MRTRRMTYFTILVFLGVFENVFASKSIEGAIFLAAAFILAGTSGE